MDGSIYTRHPDKRNAAFESIFGRPTAAHHQQSGPSSLNYHQSYNSLHQHSLPPQPSSSQTPFISHPQPLNGRLPHHLPSNAHQGQYGRPNFRASSMRTDSYSHVSNGGVIVPRPPSEEPDDGSLQALQRTGLTPAQAYQRQVYLNRIESQRPNWEVDLSTRSNDPQHFFGSDVWDLGMNNLSIDPNLNPRTSQSEQSLFSLSDNTSNQSCAPSGSTHSRVASNSFVSSPASTVASSAVADDASVDTVITRRSSDSIRTVPSPYSINGTHRERDTQDRAKSMSAATDQSRTMLEVPRTTARVRRAPLVYPALLSRVAEAFQERITLSERVKDGLTYPEAFDGREAVDKITYIIKTTDRNLALLLGRALDSQKFFHEVTYDKRLRDSPSELYQFRNRLATSFTGGDSAPDGGLFPNRPSLPGADSEDSGSSFQRGHQSTPSKSLTPTISGSSADDDSLPTGVFTLLTDCYSPTCSRDKLCYSIICPRRLEQQANLNMKPQSVLKKNMSQEDAGDADVVEPGTLWIHSVPKEVADSVSDTEKKRQEAINEVIYTERDFVRDMEYLRDCWVKPLQTSDVIQEPRRTDFLQQVFWNLRDIISVNTRLRDALNKRQRSYAVVERIGDILLDAVPYFEPFVVYGSHQLYGKYEFEKEKSSNLAFAQFVEETERKPESRKLELNGYLTKPTTRLARYPLLLEQVLKYTSEDNIDKISILKAIKIIKEFLQRVNIETGKSENRFNLWQLEQQLVFKPADVADLRLSDEKRELLYKGSLNRRGGTQSDNGDLIAFLFDHALLMVKQKAKYDQYKVLRRPIPLELLQIYADEGLSSQFGSGRGNRTLTKRSSFTKASASTPNLLPLAQTRSAEIKSDSKSGYPITFTQLGRNSYQITLYALTWVARRKWVEQITKQQGIINERSSLFETSLLSENFFIGSNRVNCAAPFAQGRRIAYGTNDGVYFADLVTNHREPMKMLALADVWQLDIMDQFELLVVLTENEVVTFPLESLSAQDTFAGLKRAKRIASHISYFKAGVCMGRPLVCVVKTSPLSTTIRALEPIDQQVRDKRKPTFRKLIQGGADTLRMYKEFYIPVESYSVHFLKTKLCVGCTKGFEIVDLDSLDTQGLLDPQDSSLDFVTRSETVKPMAIYRIENEFLLCYDDFAFYVNKSGWRAKKNFMVHWEGRPSAFALQYPYVLAIESSFVEIRHVETGQLVQIIKGNNLRCLFADTPPSAINYSHASYQRGLQGPFKGRQPMGGPAFGPPGYVYKPPYVREEILLVSDDRIMILRPSNFTQSNDNTPARSSTIRR